DHLLPGRWLDRPAQEASSRAGGGSMSALLETQGLTLAFGGLAVADSVDFRLGEGERPAVIGQNGAGQSPLFKNSAGLLKPNAGTVKFDGQDITGQSPRHIVRRGMARSFQLPQLFLDHSVRQSLELAGMARETRLPLLKALSGSANRREVDRVLELVSLTERQHEPASNLPEGQRKLLDVAMSLMLQPRHRHVEQLAL